jgi:type VI secretion system secreted protein VgrG
MTAPLATFRTGRLDVAIHSDDPLEVRVFEVEEGLSSLFVVNLEVVSANPDIDLDAVIGRPARFALVDDQTGSTLRSWSGICRSIEQVDVEESEGSLSTYEMTIVPEMWFLTQRRNHRILQQRSEPQIAIAILQEWGLTVEERLDVASYPTRDYRVQYGESDFHFVSRMLEDAGVSYFFEADEDGATMRVVLSDAPERNERVADLPYVHTPTSTDAVLATEVRILRRVRPGRYTQRDVDHRRPPEFPVLASRAGGIDPESRLERFHYTPGAFLFQQDATSGSPAGDDRGAHRADLGRGAEQVQRRLDAKRGSARIVIFRAQASGLSPGAVVALSGHPRRDLAPDRTLLVAAASHHGFATGGWEHRYEARFTDIPHRPPLTTPKPRVNGIESATVVGPAGEEIHVDEMGRVRVHFHWDRESQMNEQSSCWVPVSQPWGGAGFGAVNLPRIGQEVIVDFLGGDPDTPVVVGRVYTGVRQVPYTLPANKTQSGLKSYSSPATGGYNEMMFEDAAGRELLRIQAERDLTSLVKNDETTVVQNDSTSSIGHDEVHSVANNQTLFVGNDRMELVMGNHVRCVEGDLIQQTFEGMTIHTSKQPFLVEGDTEITLAVGNSTIKMEPASITIQADDVFINPGDGGFLSLIIESAMQPLMILTGSP